MSDASRIGSYRVDLQPIGRRAELGPGQTLLDATRAAGVELVSLCGGEGWCQSCLVRVVSGLVSPPSPVETKALSPEQLSAGLRLACETVPLSDVKVDIPPESLATQQRLSIEGQDVAVKADPLVTPLDVTLAPPTGHDLRADATRLSDACAVLRDAPVEICPAVLRTLSGQLRSQGWQARLAVRDHEGSLNTAKGPRELAAKSGQEGVGPAPRFAPRGAAPGEVVAVLAPGDRLFGLAVDIGTTKLAAYLVDLATGHTVAKTGEMNPQIGYGEDVISRIGYCAEHADGRIVLQARLVETLNTLVTQLCHEAGAAQPQIVDAVAVGNTAMHHLFAGLPVDQLARAPYVAAVSDPLDLRASDLGLVLASGASVHLPANIAGFVGADHVAMALATGAWEETDRCVVALDIGTNTEVTLTRGGRIWCCSCASGPAFEGAHIQDGMRAAPGAIERVQIGEDGKPHLKTIGDQPPVGICGSGILDAVSELLRAGVINQKGAFLEGAPGVSAEEGVHRYILAAAETTSHGRPVVINRKDINEVQLAKAAIRTGVDVLLHEAGASWKEIEEFIIAGAFGTYLDVESSVNIGMFPPLPMERFHQVGNAAGAGARQMLVSASRRCAAAALARKVTYVELTVHREFTRRFLKALYLSS